MSTFVYFISYEDGPVKIGKANDVKKRLAGLQTSHPHPLFVIGVMSGPENLEAKLHDRFRHDHIRGEWFKRSDDLLRYILENRNVSLFPNGRTVKAYQLASEDTENYGPVQVIDEDHEMYGKYGLWDDNDDAVLEHECDFCQELKKRKMPEDEECTTCIWVTDAIVYFGPINDNYDVIPHECLRRLDEETELAKCQDIAENFVSGFTKLSNEGINGKAQSGQTAENAG